MTEVDIEQEFDALNRITTINHHHLDKVVRQEWDAVGNRTKLSVDGLASSTATYEWDSRNRLAAIHTPVMGDNYCSYDANGRKTSVTLMNGIVCSYSYDVNGRMTQLEYKKPDETSVFLEQLTYDPRGNITQRVDTEGTHTYQYDWLDQLTRADYPGGAYEEFTYDASGNRTALTTAGGTTTYFLDDADQLTATAGPGTTESVAFIWSLNGELESALSSGQTSPTSYYWDTRSMLVAVSLPSGQVLTYTYLPEQWLGWRLTAPTTAGVERYLWDAVSGNIVGDINPNGELFRRYNTGPGYDQHLAFYNSDTGQSRAFITDHLGSVVKLSDFDRADQATYSYAAFSSLRASNVSANSDQPFHFTGREWDSALGLQYNRARWYAPEVGRFPTRDPKGWRVDLNPYRYAKNQSVILRDPTGLEVEVLIFDAVGIGSSSYGHAAVSISGTVFSFGRNGWCVADKTMYLYDNCFRESRGYELAFSPVDEMLLFANFRQDAREKPAYSSVSSSCVSRLMLTFNSTFLPSVFSQLALDEGTLPGKAGLPTPKDLENALKRGDVASTRVLRVNTYTKSCDKSPDLPGMCRPVP